MKLLQKADRPMTVHRRLTSKLFYEHQDSVSHIAAITIKEARNGELLKADLASQTAEQLTKRVMYFELRSTYYN